MWYFAVLVFSMGVVLVAIAMVPIRVPAGALGIGGMILIAMAIVTGWTAGGLLFVGALFAVAGAVETARRMV